MTALYVAPGESKELLLWVLRIAFVWLGWQGGLVLLSLVRLARAEIKVWRSARERGRID